MPIAGSRQSLRLVDGLLTVQPRLLSAAGVTHATRDLCAYPAITQVTVMVSTSGGGPTAVTVAARHPGPVDGLVLHSAVGWLPRPDPRSRRGAHVVFAAPTEPVTRAAIGALARAAPDSGLRLLLGALSTRPARDVVAERRWRTPFAHAESLTAALAHARLIDSRAGIRQRPAGPAGRADRPSLPHAGSGMLISAAAHPQVLTRREEETDGCED